MKTITPLTNWLAVKIISFLTSKEGCSASAPEYTQDGSKLIVQDAFGFRYEVQIKPLSRINAGFEEEQAAHFKNLLVDVYATK